MKVLWITFWGSWTKPLLRALKHRINVEVIIPSEGTPSYREDKFEGITLHCLTLPPKRGLYRNMTHDIYSYYEKIISSFNPDIIHVHGTEKNLAQIQNFVKNIPVVISIQGLLSGCLRYNLAFLSKQDMLPHTSIKNLIGHGGLYNAERMCENGVNEYEEDILKHGKYYFGRTDWDKAHTMMMNPNSKYYYGEELLRPAFYNNKGLWDSERCDKHTIMMPSGYNPLKGMHIAIQAVALLKKIYPDVRIKIPGLPQSMLCRKGIKKFLIGEEYIEYCLSLVKCNNLTDNVEFLPYLNENEMVNEMLKANVFLSCSTIDNSSNAVGEAAMLGVPIVASAVGGILSIVNNEKTGLLVPSGDPYVMAYQISRIFDDIELAKKLSENEYSMQIERCNPNKVAQQYLYGYAQCITLHTYKK